MEEKIKENSRKQNEILNENLIKQMEERFDKNKEETNEILGNKMRTPLRV